MKSILLKAREVRAVLAGDTMLLRKVKPQPFIVIDGNPLIIRKAKPGEFPIQRDVIESPYQVGDKLWVEPSESERPLNSKHPSTPSLSLSGLEVVSVEVEKVDGEWNWKYGVKRLMCV